MSGLFIKLVLYFQLNKYSIEFPDIIRHILGQRDYISKLYIYFLQDYHYASFLCHIVGRLTSRAQDVTQNAKGPFYEYVNPWVFWIMNICSIHKTFGLRARDMSTWHYSLHNLLQFDKYRLLVLTQTDTYICIIK